MTATQPRPSIGAMHCRPVEIVRVDLDRRIEGRRNACIDGRLEENVVAPVLVHERGARLARRAHVADRRQFFEIQGYARRDILGFGARRRDAHGDELADMPDLAGRERRLLGDLEARQSRHCPDRVDAAQIRRGENPIPNGVGNFDPANAGMGQRAANEGDVLHAGEADIADILPQAPHQPLVLLARQPGADALGRFRERQRRSMRDVLDQALRRADELASWAAQFFENGEVIGAGDRQQRARRMSRRAQRVELARIVNERGKLARSVGDGERLRRSRRRPHGGQGRDLLVA